MPNNEMEAWEKKFWQIVEEKGIGANVDFPLALREMFREQLTLARREERENLKKVVSHIDLNTHSDLLIKGGEMMRTRVLGVLDLLSPTSITRNEDEHA